MISWPIAVALIVALTVLAAVAYWIKGAQRREVVRALSEFRRQREVLEARFFDMASRLGKPRGLRWTRCDWQPEVTFARDVRTGLLTAFVGAEIAFEAIEGGDMEDVAAVGTIREGSAVFHYQSGQWGTGGKALFNMNPREAISRLQGQFVEVASPPAN